MAPGIDRVQTRISDIMQRFDHLNAVPSMRPDSPEGASPETEETSARNATGTGAPEARKSGPSHPGPGPGHTDFQRILNALVDEKSEDYGMPASLVRAVMQAESAGNPDAVSPAGARGLMQLMPQTAQMLGVDPDDPVQNLEGGIRYLKAMQERFGDLDTALAAYNAGPGAVEKYGGIPPYKETMNYVKKIRDILNR